ncbi:LOW QUALITY PROTEIN: hypothetical protein CRUP_036666 [Coryphaenoides rupestris]|nr:LOW QUALITY PROTEIN: hypothetical protein CRUP_036666 [Coryphaenoides rupestris]
MEEPGGSLLLRLSPEKLQSAKLNHETPERPDTEYVMEAPDLTCWEDKRELLETYRQSSGEGELDGGLGAERALSPLLVFTGGSTRTAQAFQYLLRKGFPGGRNSSSVVRVVVLLSDGRSQEGVTKGGVAQAASQLKEGGVVLFAVGLRHPRWAELHELASAPLESHVFFAEHFSDAVNGLCTTLTTFSVCNATPTGCQSDPRSPGDGIRLQQQRHLWPSVRPRPGQTASALWGPGAPIRSSIQTLETAFQKRPAQACGVWVAVCVQRSHG